MNTKKTVFLSFEPVALLSAKTEPNIKFEEYCVKSLATAAEMMNESVYVIDPYEPCFRYVSSGGIFPCGRSSKEIMRLGYDYYSEAVHPDDLPLVMQAIKEVVSRPCLPDTLPDDLAYMVFDFRIRYRKKYLPVCHKMIPVIIDNRVRFIYCTVSDSVNETAGNLIAYYHTGTDCLHYSFESNRWNRKPMTTITSQENEILTLSRFGYSEKKIAEILCLSPYTVRNHKKDIFRKFHVKTICQALIFARNNRLNIK